MESSLATIVVSAGVGGLAGSLFPSLRSAVSYVVLEAPAFISKTQAEAKFEAEQSASRSELLLAVHKRTVATRDAVVKAKLLYDQVSVLEAEPERSRWVTEASALIPDMKNSVAYLEVFDKESLHNKHAARLVEYTIDFARFNVALLESRFSPSNTSLGHWIELDGAFSLQTKVGVKWGTLASSISGSLERLDRSEKDQRRRDDFHLREKLNAISEAKRKRLLLKVFLCASFLLLIGGSFLIAKRLV